jgi:hypothetical protein
VVDGQDREQYRRANDSTTYAVARLKKIKRTSPLFELARLLVRFDHVVDDIMAGSSAIRQSKTILARS